MGSKLPSQGTKRKMTLYEHGCIEAEGHIWEVMMRWELFLSQKLLTASGESNSSRITFLSAKCRAQTSVLCLVLWDAMVGGGGLGTLGEHGVLALWVFATAESVFPLRAVFSLDLSSAANMLLLSLGDLMLFGSKVM